MFHLPKDGARVKVWPDPKHLVANSPPSLGASTGWMPAYGRVVSWDAFRYRQYLEGLLHFFDPRAKDDASHRDNPIGDDAKYHAKHHHLPEPPQHIKDQLKAVALRDGKGLYLDEAKKEEAELKAQASSSKLVDSRTWGPEVENEKGVSK